MLLFSILQCEALEVLDETAFAVSLRTSLHTSISLTLKNSKVPYNIKEQAKTHNGFYLFSVKGEFYLNLLSNVSLAEKKVKIKHILR